MSNSLLIGLSNQMVLRRHLDIVANNLANITTTGYKTETPLFEDYLQSGENGGDATDSHFVHDYGVYRDLGVGKMASTGRPLDLAINGSAYFMVETDDGIKYSRGGAFQIDEAGQLVTEAGHPVLDESRRPVQMPIENTEINVTPDGAIANQDGPIGRLGVVTFENDQAMNKYGENLLETSENAAQALPDDFKIVPRALESSNVRPVVEMTKLITISKAYEQTASLIDTNNDMTRRMIQTLGRTG